MDGSVVSAIDEWARGKSLEAMLRAMQPFAHILGAEAARAAPAGDRTLSPKALRHAYHTACKQLHPDRHVGSSPRTQKIAEELFKVLSAAYLEHQSRALCSPQMTC